MGHEDTDDYDGHKVFRGCLYSMPFSLLLWLLIIMLIAWIVS